MMSIPNEILDLIKKLYPTNSYFGAYDFKPEWIEYPYEKIIQEIIELIKKRCEIEDICLDWDRNRDSSFTLRLSLTRPNPCQVYNIDNKIKTFFSNSKNEPIYIMTIRISVLGPFARKTWQRIYLSRNKRINYEFCTEPPTPQYKILFDCVKKILYEKGIMIISEEILKTPIEGMTGSPDISDPTAMPNVYNCLFGEGVGTGTKRNKKDLRTV